MSRNFPHSGHRRPKLTDKFSNFNWRGPRKAVLTVDGWSKSPHNSPTFICAEFLFGGLSKPWPLGHGLLEHPPNEKFKNSTNVHRCRDISKIFFWYLPPSHIESSVDRQTTRLQNLTLDKYEKTPHSWILFTPGRILYLGRDLRVGVAAKSMPWGFSSTSIASRRVAVRRFHGFNFRELNSKGISWKPKRSRRKIDKTATSAGLSALD